MNHMCSSGKCTLLYFTGHETLRAEAGRQASKTLLLWQQANDEKVEDAARASQRSCAKSHPVQVVADAVVQTHHVTPIRSETRTRVFALSSHTSVLILAAAHGCIQISWHS